MLKVDLFPVPQGTKIEDWWAEIESDLRTLLVDGGDALVRVKRIRAVTQSGSGKMSVKYEVGSTDEPAVVTQPIVGTLGVSLLKWGLVGTRGMALYFLTGVSGVYEAAQVDDCW